MSLGSWSGDGHTDFHDVVGAILDRRAGILVVANGGDATIRTFGLDGGWRRTRGGTGGGPQEFRDLTALFGYRGDSLLAFDERRDEASVWSYADGDVRRIAAPSLPEDSLRYPTLQGALAPTGDSCGRRRSRTASRTKSATRIRTRCSSS
ncbi:hypothetical protein [Candidatus Palauibacter sp.]|uniref:hypothetical protein n=1 Tax=Candidatus Palauibacter sp. TaxID=3101350 RepID=UPI003CC5D0BA